MESDEENVLNTTKKSRKIIDSDSENETENMKDLENDENVNNNHNDLSKMTTSYKIKRKRLLIHESSDSESGSSQPTTLNDDLLNKENKKHSGSDSENAEIETEIDNKNEIIDSKHINNSDSETISSDSNTPTDGSDSDSDIKSDNSDSNSETNILSQKVSSKTKSGSDSNSEIAKIEAEINDLDKIVDSKSKNDSQKSKQRSYRLSSDSDTEIVQPQPYKKKRRKEEKLKTMSGKEALEQRREIFSESQRMMRESQISLPYHKPKSYTIKEFLEKRTKLTSLLPKDTKTLPVVAIKMPQSQMELVSKKLEMRIKEVQEFYKSESDTEEEVEKIGVKVKSWLSKLVEKAICISDGKNEANLKVFEETNTNVEEKEKKQSKMELIREKLGHIQPILSRSPYIDLNDDSSNEVTKLVERFIKHTTKKNPNYRKVNLDIISVNNGQVHKETVAMNVDEKDEKNIIETPGAKLQKLRVELQQQIAQKRSELWQQKLSNEEKPENIEEVKEIDDEEYLDDEEEMTESSIEDVEEEEDNIEIKDKPRQKLQFLDDEAEVSEMEEDEENEELNEGDENENEAGFEGDDESNDENKEKSKKRVLKRILKAFTEDSDEEDCKITEIKENSESGKIDLNKERHGEKKNTKDDSKEEGQINSDSTVSLSHSSEKENLNKIEGNENENFQNKDLDPTTNFEFPSNQTETIGNKTPQRITQKLNSEFDFLTPITYLTGLQNLNNSSEKKLKDSSSLISPFRMPSPLSTQPFQSNLQKNLFGEPSQNNLDQLSDFCTGKFLKNRANDNEMPTTQDLIDVCSGHFPGLSQSQPEIKSLDNDQTGLISQLLNDELSDAEEVKATGLIESDNDDELEVKTRKTGKKVAFSDDETSEEEQESEEEIQLQDNVDYDSEENQVQLKPGDFFEKEAELSESEWGSADEDEANLDQLEFEQGDSEKFDENQMRQDLERIHMRQLLDDDNREVKLLQELLLEDGELHGTGRQRQFRWRNIDSTTEEEIQGNEEEAYLDEEEEESEEQWRKRRHEREMFLKNKTKLSKDLISSDSQLLKIGSKIVQKTQISSQTITIPSKPSIIQQPFNLLSKRGSFLNRSDQVLERLTEYTKVGTGVIGSAKNSRNFLFQTVSTCEKTIKENKRKAADGTPNAIKKLRLDNLSPGFREKKNGEKSDRVKKLFGNW